MPHRILKTSSNFCSIFGRHVTRHNLPNWRAGISNCSMIPARNHKKNTKKQGLHHTVALPFTLKGILRQQKEGLWKLKDFTMQKYNLQKIL